MIIIIIIIIIKRAVGRKYMSQRHLPPLASSRSRSLLRALGSDLSHRAGDRLQWPEKEVM